MYRVAGGCAGRLGLPTFSPTFALILPASSVILVTVSPAFVVPKTSRETETGPVPSTSLPIIVRVRSRKTAGMQVAQRSRTRVGPNPSPPSPHPLTHIASLYTQPGLCRVRQPLVGERGQRCPKWLHTRPRAQLITVQGTATATVAP